LRESKYISDDEIISNYHEEGQSWKKTSDISRFPLLKADNQKFLVALYNMALEEMQLDIRPSDSTFQAGALWPDTWTRDAVYSIHLAYAMILPEISKRTLEKQTLSHPKEALQDTGSGGSWPISTDRVVWAMAAWEYYLTTGDTDWLNNCYEMLSYTAQKDLHVAFDNKVNLFKGETCSMDWRTHTYPNWYSNATIGSSFSSGTNALHAFLYRFLGEAGKILDKPTEETTVWNDYAQKVSAAINKHFWLSDKGYYSAYLHPETENYLIASRGDCMSNGLAVILGIADDKRTQSIASHFPLYAYGAATLYPSIPDDYAYHNKAVWPVWETYLMLGAHQSGNVEATAHILKSIVRQAALFLTNKENMTYDTGYDRNTALNSDRQLWSVAASLGMIYKILFGMKLAPEGLHFAPLIPEDFHAPFELNHFPYRKAELDILLHGSGNVISYLLLDGEKQKLPFILPANTEGRHHIEIAMTRGAKNTFHLVEAGQGKCWSPA
jgi:glycogen debranching enzyme